MNHDHEKIRSSTVHKNDASNKLHALTPSVNPGEPLALMDCGEFSLLISSKDIVTLMSAQKVIAPTTVHACGAIEYEQEIIPIFTFNKSLQLQTNLPSMQMTLVIIQYQSYLFALGCFALEKIEIADLHFYSVPLSMSSRKQPFTQFAVVNKRAAGLSSAVDLWRLLSMRNAVQAIPGIKTQTIMQGAG